MNTRHQEILTALFNNPEGLTTVQVQKWCRKQAGSELPDDTSVISRLIFDVRAKNWLSSYDTVQGKVHTLTTDGKAELAKALADEIGIDKAAIQEVAEEELEAIDEYLIGNACIPELSVESMTIMLGAIRHNLQKLEPGQLEFIDKLELLSEIAESSFIDQTSANTLRDIADDLRKAGSGSLATTC